MRLLLEARLLERKWVTGRRGRSLRQVSNLKESLRVRHVSVVRAETLFRRLAVEWECQYLQMLDQLSHVPGQGDTGWHARRRIHREKVLKKKHARQIRVDYGQLVCVKLQEIRYQENRNLDHECERATQVQQACRGH